MYTPAPRTHDILHRHCNWVVFIWKLHFTFTFSRSEVFKTQHKFQIFVDIDLTSHLSHFIFFRPWEDYHSNEHERSDELKSLLRRLLSANEVLQHTATVQDLVDEHSISVFVKVATKIFEFVEIIHENITTDEILPSLSLVVTVIFILIGGYVMSYLGNFHIKC